MKFHHIKSVGWVSIKVKFWTHKQEQDRQNRKKSIKGGKMCIIHSIFVSNKYTLYACIYACVRLYANFFAFIRLKWLKHEIYVYCKCFESVSVLVYVCDSTLYRFTLEICLQLRCVFYNGITKHTVQTSVKCCHQFDVNVRSVLVAS